MFRRSLLTLSAVVTLLVGSVGPAQAGNAGGEPLSYPGPSFEGSVEGSVVTLSGTGCLPGETVNIDVEGGPSSEVIADDEGGFGAVVDLGDLTGEITITATCGDLAQVLSVTIAADVPAAATGELPRTGSDSSIPLARYGTGLIGLGAIALYVAFGRRRRLTAA